MRIVRSLATACCGSGQFSHSAMPRPKIHSLSVVGQKFHFFGE